MDEKARKTSRRRRTMLRRTMMTTRIMTKKENWQSGQKLKRSTTNVSEIRLCTYAMLLSVIN
jgi:hypothetical protein